MAARKACFRFALKGPYGALGSNLNWQCVRQHFTCCTISLAQDWLSLDFPEVPEVSLHLESFLVVLENPVMLRSMATCMHSLHSILLSHLPSPVFQFSTCGAQGLPSAGLWLALLGGLYGLYGWFWSHSGLQNRGKVGAQLAGSAEVGGPGEAIPGFVPALGREPGMQWGAAIL